LSDPTDDPLKALAAAILASQHAAIASPDAFRMKDLRGSPVEQMLRRQERMVDRLVGHPRHGRASPQLAELQQQVSQLQTELVQTRQALAETRSELAHESMNPNSRSALERLLIVAIAGGYGVQKETHKRKESIAMQLSHDAMEIYGFTVDPKTVRKYVTSAWDKLKKRPR
jgi:hypothetical protein